MHAPILLAYAHNPTGKFSLVTCLNSTAVELLNLSSYISRNLQNSPPLSTHARMHVTRVQM